MSEPTIKDLIPQLVVDPVFSYTKSSQRYLGSSKLNLQRPSRSPSSSRQFMKGDPVHLIDWRAFARNDQLLIREQRDEASSKVLVLLDASETMDWPSPDIAEVPKKFELGLRVAFHLAYSHLKKGDMVKIGIWQQQDTFPITGIPLKSSSDVLRLFEIIKSREFEINQLKSMLISYHAVDFRFDQTYFISDVLREQDFSWLFPMNRLVCMIHTLSSLEVDLEWLNASACYFDESAQKKEFLGSSLLQNQSYRKRIQEWTSQLDHTFRRNMGQYLLVHDKTSLKEYWDLLFV